MDIYKCEVCGNVVEKIYDGGGVLVCCGQDMVLQEINVEETTYDKHIPVVEETENEIKIQIGSELHPMENDHHIEWIALVTPKGIIRRKIQVGEEPKVIFGKMTDEYAIYAYCNIHGLYKSE